MFGVSFEQNLAQSFDELKYRGSYHDLFGLIGGNYQCMSLNMVNISLEQQWMADKEVLVTQGSGGLGSVRLFALLTLSAY